MSNDLRLNSLDRFMKSSERLVLEEHGHCEVPAGCGGVVLRWLNPNAGVPVIFRSGFADETAIFVDEAPTASGRVTVPYGEHVLAVCAEFQGDSPLCFWLAGLRDTSHDRDPVENRVIASLSTADDGSWRATFTEPDSATWTSGDFDDSQWTPLAAIEIDNDTLEGSTRWRHEQMTRLGARSLDLGGRHKVWIRKRFQMEH